MRSLAISNPCPFSALRRSSVLYSDDPSTPPLLPISRALLQGRNGGKPGDWHFGGALRIACASGSIRRDGSNNRIFASIADYSVEQSVENAQFPKGDMWSVHKFGGTCMGTSKRIQNVADIVLNDSSERKLVVVSAMSKVTDMMYDLVCKAQSRDDSYLSAIDNVFEKHMLAAKDLLDGEDLTRFLSQLQIDINNLKAMLRAIYIGSKSFSFFLIVSFNKSLFCW